MCYDANVSDIIDKYTKTNAPYDGRLPTCEELDRAVEQPQEADDAMQRYLERFPIVEHTWRRLQKLAEQD